MCAKKRTAITPTRQDNYPEWYQQVVKAADLAESAVVRGCMVMKPWGYALWENIQKQLDHMIKQTGHENIYCPLFVPLSFIEKEADHVDGFAKECAVVTHHRLEADGQGGLKPAGPLEEPLIVRPTSETIIGDLFAKWVQSYRDLPLLMNQWANVVRWEMRPRLFLRTTEFLWQEGHTAHATKQEAIDETLKMLNVYQQFSEEYLAMPVITGEKTESERFPGAENTYCIEAMMQDKKALQAGTSHFLGQNFSKAFEIKYLNDQGAEEHTWTTSWGVSTRLIGGLIMTHSDDNGLIVPPKIAGTQVIIVPLVHKEEDKAEIMAYCDNLQQQLSGQHYHGQPIRAKVDTKSGRAGDKVWNWIKKGVPIRLEIGKKELEANAVFMGRRDKDPKDKAGMPLTQFVEQSSTLLDDIQNTLFERAKSFQERNTSNIDSKEAFYDYFKSNAEDAGGFAIAPWIGDLETENTLKQDLKVTARCIPLSMQDKTGTCIFTGKTNAPYTVFARSY